MKGKTSWFWLVIVTIVWLAVGLVLIHGFVPVDFYGEGAWYAQAILRWETEGWPATLIGGPFVGEFGFGTFTLWIYFSLLWIFFKVIGFHLASMSYLSLLSTSAALLLTGILVNRLAKDQGLWPGLFFLLLVLSPLPLVISHTPRPLGLMELWVTGSVALIILSRKPIIRNLGFAFLPMGFWVHQIGGVMALCLFLVMGINFLVRRKYGSETLWLLAGGILVAGISLLVPWMANKFTLVQEIAIHYNKSLGPKPLLSSFYIPVIMAFAGIMFLAFPLRKARLDLDKGLLALITLGLVLLPMLFGMRPRRVFQFVYPLLWVMLYIGFIYAAQLGRLFKYGFLALVIGGMCFYWWRSRSILYITARNPEYIRKAEAFMARNQPLIASVDTVFMALHGEGYLFWLLPREKQLIASPYFRGPVRDRNLVLITDHELKAIPYLAPVDSLDLGFIYSFYGSRPFRKIYLCQAIQGTSSD